MRRIAVVALLVFAVAGSASAQASIDPGMSKDQVIAKLGKPTSEHSSGTTTFLYYRNGEEKKMGMSDMVAIENGKVVDAVFRSSSRKYTGKSSSPAPVSAEAAIIKGGGTVKSPPMKMPAKPAAAATKKPAATTTKKPAVAATKKPAPAPPAAKTATPAPTKKP